MEAQNRTSGNCLRAWTYWLPFMTFRGKPCPSQQLRPEDGEKINESQGSDS